MDTPSIIALAVGGLIGLLIYAALVRWIFRIDTITLNIEKQTLLMEELLKKNGMTEADIADLYIINGGDDPRRTK